MSANTGYPADILRTPDWIDCSPPEPLDQYDCLPNDTIIATHSTEEKDER